MMSSKLFKPDVDTLLRVMEFNFKQQKDLGLAWVKDVKFKREDYKELVEAILNDPDDDYFCLVNNNNSLIIAEVNEMHIGHPIVSIRQLRATDGSGKVIMSLLTEWAKSKGCRAITLSTSSGCHNRRVYRALGLGEPVGFNFIMHLGNKMNKGNKYVNTKESTKGC